MLHLPLVIPLIILAVFSTRNYIRKRRNNPAGLPLPPGPPRLPIFGNLFGMKDPRTPWLTYAEWNKKYGDLLYIEILGQKMLVINSEKIAKDLLDKRSQNYSDRPLVPMITLTGWDFSLVFLPYGACWRKYRKATHQVLNQPAILNYRHILLNTTHQLVENLAHVPEEMEKHLLMFTTSTIMRIVYGYQIAPRDDFFVSIADRASDMLSSCLLPSMVNMFPVLQHLPDWFPGAGFKRHGRIGQQLTRQLCDTPFDFVRKQMAEGTVPHSMVSELIEKNEEEDVIKCAAGSIYSAAVGTSASALSAFMMAMVMFPDVRKKAQAEIDRITGGTRMPDFSDRPSMVYLEAMYREVLRWSEVTPLGVPHLTTGHDMYEGYFIPKDTIVFANIWSMTHNEDKYPDPMRFMPERFIDGEGQLTDDMCQQQFGFGRRICVGKYLAEASIWIAMVSVLAVFNINKAKDQQGREIDVLPQYNTGTLSHPKPFPFSITPRLQQLIQQIEVDVEEACYMKTTYIP